MLTWLRCYWLIRSISLTFFSVFTIPGLHIFWAYERHPYLFIFMHTFWEIKSLMAGNRHACRKHYFEEIITKARNWLSGNVCLWLRMFLLNLCDGKSDNWLNNYTISNIFCLSANTWWRFVRVVIVNWMAVNHLNIRLLQKNWKQMQTIATGWHSNPIYSTSTKSVLIQSSAVSLPV